MDSCPNCGSFMIKENFRGIRCRRCRWDSTMLVPSDKSSRWYQKLLRYLGLGKPRGGRS